MRLIAIPGARSRKIVTIKFTAPPVVEIVKKISDSAYTSIPSPGEYVGSVNGTYANQPACGACPITGEMYKKIPENKNVQYVNAFSRGNAISRAPIISGTRNTANPDKIGEAYQKIMVTPCIVKIWL